MRGEHCVLSHSFSRRVVRFWRASVFVVGCSGALDVDELNSFSAAFSLSATGVPGLEEMADGRRCGGSLTGLWSILIGSVCMPVDCAGAARSPVVCVDMVFVPGGRIAALGDEGADVGACIAIEGIGIGAGGVALLDNSVGASG